MKSFVYIAFLALCLSNLPSISNAQSTGVESSSIDATATSDNQSETSADLMSSDELSNTLDASESINVTETYSVSETIDPSQTYSGTIESSETASINETVTESFDATESESIQPSETVSESMSGSESESIQPSETAIETASGSESESVQPSETFSESASGSESESIQPSETASESVSASESETVQPSEPASQSVSASESETVQPSEPASQSESASQSETVQPSEPASQSVSASESESVQPSEPASQSESASESETVQPSEPASQSVSASESETVQPSEPASQSVSASESETVQPSEPASQSVSASESETVQPSEPASQSLSASESETVQPSEPASQSVSASESETVQPSEPASQSVSASESETVQPSEPASQSVSASESETVQPSEPASQSVSASESESVQPSEPASQSVSASQSESVQPSESASESETSSYAYSSAVPSSSVIEPTPTSSSVAEASSSVVEETTTPIPTHAPVDQGDLYPYGDTASDSSFTQAEPWVSEKINFKTPMPFGKAAFTQAYVLLDGAISFGNARFAWSFNFTTAQSKGKNLLAPFWTWMTFYQNMTVYYHLYEEGDDTTDADTQAILTRGTQDVISNYGNDDFVATTVLVATWDKAIPDAWYGFPCSTENTNTDFYAQYCATPEQNTFQCVYISDGNTAFSVRRYKSGDMNWNYEANRKIVIGWVNAHEIFDYGDVSTTTLDSDKGNYGETGMYLDKVGEVESPTAACRKFHKSMVATTRDDDDYKTMIDGLYDCPCTASRLGPHWWELSSTQESGNTYYECYALSTVAKRRLDRLDGITLNKKCCYKVEMPVNGTWFEEYVARRSASFFTGRILGHDPWEWTSSARSYALNDELPYSQCCLKSDTCHLFNEIRPIVGCNKKATFRTGRALGDPHIKTLDGKDYTMNGWGEYNLVVVESESFVLQGRTDRISLTNGDKINATVFVGFAAEEDGVQFQVLLNSAGDGMELRAGGQDITTDFYATDNFEEPYGNDGVTVKKIVSNDRITAEVSFGSLISLSVFRGKGNIDFKLTIPTSMKGTLKGMMGNFNDDVSDEFILPDGTQLATNLTEKEILEDFASIWQVNSADSVFFYDDGEAATDYRHDDFIPLYLEDLDQEVVSAAVSFCGGQSASACIYDYLATNDESFAQNTNDIDDEANTENSDLSNTLPTLTVSASDLTNGRWELTHDSASTIQLVGDDDDGDDLTYLIITDVKSQATVDANGLVSFTPDSDDPVILSFRANDTKGGLSNVLTIPVTVCTGCSSQGACDSTLTRASSISDSDYLLFQCDCQAAWSGEECEDDIDYCDDDPCLTGQECTDIEGATQGNSPVGHTCGACPDGFEASGDRCSDINECLDSPCVNANCENTQGSYVCTCKSGYTVFNSSHCEDIDECSQKLADCSQLCTNNDGGFTCSCNTGYALNGDGKSCDSQNTLPAACDACDDFCVVDGSNFFESCACNTGYKLDADGTSCNDVNECEEGETPCTQVCTDLTGSYSCSCHTGFKLADDQVTCEACISPNYGVNCASRCQCNGRGTCDSVRGCVCNEGWQGTDCSTDVNECANDPCAVGQTCVNTAGSYQCNCQTGWQKSGENCVDIDECASVLTHDCDLSVENCDNTDGTYGCSCKTGFKRETPSGVCEDINECETGTHTCEQLCDNVLGFYNCRCRYGYRLLPDRNNCEEVSDICTEIANLNCSHSCEVDRAAETAVCVCNTGYYLDTDKETCLDINECNFDETNLCSEKGMCSNSDGSFTCGCSIGSKLENDGRTCATCTGGTWGTDCANECGCGPKGTCDTVVGCQCEAGYTGEFCMEDIDECATGTKVCSGTTVCINTVGGAYCGCEDGFTKSGTSCVDDDECTDGTDDCSQVCTNVPGSYACSCHSGYTMVDGKCTDVDECTLGLAGCMQGCENKDGSFVCTCFDDYKLDYDGVSCSGTIECGPNSCEVSCAKVAGVDLCQCPLGSVTNVNDCIDLDLCSDADVCDDLCYEINNNASYVCACSAGTKLDANGYTCTACVKGRWGLECAEECSCNAATTASCDKLDGSCDCVMGYEGVDCSTNIDECTTVTPCLAVSDSTCKDTPGSYICQCNAGFMDDGSNGCEGCGAGFWGIECLSQCDCDTSHSTCRASDGFCVCDDGWEGSRCDTDTDECDGSTDNCTLAARENWVCSNLPGTYECSCSDGYNDNGTHCENYDECQADHTNECDHECQDASPGYTCTCDSGYTLNSTDLRQCHDNDECASSNGGCDHICTNEDGSFTCTCNNGYTLQEDGTSCTETNTYNFVMTMDIYVANITFDPLHDTYKTLEVEVKAKMLAYLQSQNPKVLDVIINKLSKGSLVIDATTIFDTSSDSDVTGELIEALIQLSQSDVTINGQPATPVIVYNNTEINENIDRCAVLMSADPCEDDKTCALDSNNVPYCKGDDDDDLDIALIVGLCIGIPLLIIVIVLIIVVIYFKTKNKELVRVASREGHYNENISRPTSAKSNAGLIMNPE